MSTRCKPTNRCPRKISTQESIEIWAFSSTIGDTAVVYTWNICLDLHLTLAGADISGFNTEGCLDISASAVQYSGNVHHVTSSGDVIMSRVL